MKWIARPLLFDARLRSWLLDAGSLTAKIKAELGGFSLRQDKSGFDYPHVDEAAALHCRSKSQAYVRDVLLLSHGKAVVYAHSLVARKSLRGPWRTLRTLGRRPLGEALFSDPQVLRLPLEFAVIGSNHPLYRKACAHLAVKPARLWARRSLFYKNGQPIMVSEVFLPGIGQ